MEFKSSIKPRTYKHCSDSINTEEIISIRLKILMLTFYFQYGHHSYNSCIFAT
ncbi:hypothetical protein SAMN04487911_12618 [Arenibacter nanhaiticus]|uniref:Uncharacterized protein n=1 Tax=Arenibacter nanhaiticus TaxID=558155 RepID=A0A1M6KIU3_9FLAO|nr:hypothetical protein SAMN04487911_12618 [Arenibacter nanhaiticus]